ncbi:16S rRNA (cytosine(1402)-N(4))-methyltransferase RsmH [Thiomicrospira sp. WB1]|uniref:16S rRNA (cytosine(1402)-N(4))-methyltransferase RsmH n=1 Tax=Thiomicrospira sp. WB1 TaxID=1685380 RepID=UPI000748443D|nr:16S rRNA (cytosine(1402)-N(4))-methyltransferase RsmH [Thiomicrospira sp. WB1]KUJ71376.1 ribosomal RNA small subunit methyltransferase H [Thiomicrospira sp. WB1]
MRRPEVKQSEASHEPLTPHAPVLLEESLRALAIDPDGRYIDGTFGRGGHSGAILNALSPSGRLLAIDQDPEAVKWAKQTFSADPRFDIAHARFDELVQLCEARDWVGKVNGVFLDIGVSSPQLDEAERGFSFMREGPLDMRMNPEAGLSAAQWLAEVDEKTLVKVLRDYGEERFAGRIAKAIKAVSGTPELQTTTQLAEVVKAASPKTERHKHPATRTFQAVRIAVNRELEGLASVLTQSLTVLAPGGRLAVISFHSLEDRIVKRFIREHATAKDLYPASPIEIEVVAPVLKKVGKPVFPSETECQRNPRARSAVLRVAQKL